MRRGGGEREKKPGIERVRDYFLKRYRLGTHHYRERKNLIDVSYILKAEHVAFNLFPHFGKPFQCAATCTRVVNFVPARTHSAPVSTPTFFPEEAARSTLAGYVLKRNMCRAI
jgi:hypothetical protein